MSQMGKLVCTADPPLCLADSMAPIASLTTSILSIAHVMSVSRLERRRSPRRDTLSAHRAFVKETLGLSRARWVRTMDDLMAISAGSLGVLFGAQYAPHGMTEAAVGEWRSARLQSMAPFAGTSEYGGGYESDSGLTKRGRMLIEWLSRHEIILDLSNAGHRTAREALAFIRQEDLPVHLMASHSGCYEIFQHPRNLPNDVLRGIADQGGYVGIPTLVQGNGGFPFVLVRHLSHASRMCGPGNVGVSEVVVGFKTLGERLCRFFSQPAVESFLGRNFEFFLFRSLP